jgi:bifunctional enzyme CysN/CysC
MDYGCMKDDDEPTSRAPVNAPSRLQKHLAREDALCRSARARSFPPVDDVPRTVEEFLARQQDVDLVPFTICGSVDDGKSTLIGRLLWEAKQLVDDQAAALENVSKSYGALEKDIDLALPVDGLAAGRDQDTTRDVAYRFFCTRRRKFIVADTPGHEQHVRNMLAGAATADVAILLADARHGLLQQTRRHAYWLSLLDIRHVVLAVNKMDLVGFDKTAFKKIEEDFRDYAQPLGFEAITAVPLSALKGDNIAARSSATPWYDGPTLLGYLDTVQTSRAAGERLVFPVQWVNRPNANAHGVSGIVVEGQVAVNDEIRVTASGQTAKVAEIVSVGGKLDVASAGSAVTLHLDRDIDALRGDMIALATRPLATTDQFTATIFWMHDDVGTSGQSYDLELANQSAVASLTAIKHRVDVDTLAHVPARSFQRNDIGVASLALDRRLVYDACSTSRTLGSFVLVDRFNQATVAAGTIEHSLRKTENVHRQPLSIKRDDRERLNGHGGKVVWFTGLSGSGKSTLANALEVALHAQGVRTYLLDGDNVRQGLNSDLGFTAADRVENIRRVAEVAKLMADAGLVVLTAFISPFHKEREMARQLIGEESFVEVYVSTPLAVCEARDVKGLYKKARSGELSNMTGIHSPYEAPVSAHATVDTQNESLSSSIERLLEYLGR